MFTALDTEGHVSLLRSHERLQRSEWISRLLWTEAITAPGSSLRVFFNRAVRSVVEACPVLRVAFPPGPVHRLSARR
jgi:hypothetical protein